MSGEIVTVIPGSGYDSNGNPRPPAATHTIKPIAIAPGNTAGVYLEHGEKLLADFTVYAHLGTVVATGDRVYVRGRECIAYVREWAEGGRGGLAIVCKSATGGGGRQ